MPPCPSRPRRTYRPATTRRGGPSPLVVLILTLCPSSRLQRRLHHRTGDGCRNPTTCRLVSDVPTILQHHRHRHLRVVGGGEGDEPHGGCLPLTPLGGAGLAADPHAGDLRGGAGAPLD